MSYNKFVAKIDATSLINSFGHCENDCHALTAISRRRLAGKSIAPHEGDLLRLLSEVPSDWQQNFSNSARLVDHIFNEAHNILILWYIFLFVSDYVHF